MMAEFVGAKVIERTLSNGLIARTSSLSPYANTRFYRLAEAQYPDADRKPFLQEHPDSVLPILDEKGWSTAQKEVLNARWDYWAELVIVSCVDIVGDHEALIASHAPYIARLRKHLELPEDPWEATLIYAILEDRQDSNNLLQDAQGITPVTAGEVEAGLRIFRCQVQQLTAGNP